MFAAVGQENTGEETTGIGGAVSAAGEASQEAAEETFNLFGSAYDLYRNILDYITSAQFIGKVFASALIVLLGLLAYRVLTRSLPRLLRWRRRRDDRRDVETVTRIKRQDTAITLVRNALRYVIFTVIVLLVLSIFIQDPLPAAAGATIIAAVLGFGAQSFLRDIIAGFSIVFEGQYSVGDFIEVHPPQGVAGIVEELGLRMTKIRTLSGEMVFIPNGAMTGVTNYVSGQQRFNVEVQLSDAEAASRIIGSLGETSELYVRPPRLLRREESDDGRVRLHIQAGVLPSMAWLVEENLVERIKAAAGEEALAAEPLVYKVDQANLRRIRELIPETGEQTLGNKPS